MDRQVKIILIVSGSVVVATALGFGIYYLVKNKTDKKTNEDGTNPFIESANTTPVETPVKNGGGYQPLIAPTFNVENELSNSMVQLRGQTLYPKEKSAGGWDYSNIRSSAEVNTSSGWFWDSDNKITTIYKGNPIGKVLSDTTTELNGYPYRWLKVSLTNTVNEHAVGYVRADTVTFKPRF